MCAADTDREQYNNESIFFSLHSLRPAQVIDVHYRLMPIANRSKVQVEPIAQSERKKMARNQNEVFKLY